MKQSIFNVVIILLVILLGIGFYYQTKKINETLKVQAETMDVHLEILKVHTETIKCLVQ